MRFRPVWWLALGAIPTFLITAPAIIESPRAPTGSMTIENAAVAVAPPVTKKPKATTTTTTIDPQAVALWIGTIKVNEAVARNELIEQARRDKEEGDRLRELARQRILASLTTTTTVQTPTSYTTDFGSLADVVQCIKDHESGNYTEQSHIWDGSGAYQFIPGTWRYYFGRWQAEYNAAHPDNPIPYYSYAYQAPPWVQDAVLLYTLTHGGAHNWDSSFGDDPCTQGLP